MKKNLLLTLVIIFFLSASNAFANDHDTKTKTENSALAEKTGNTLSEEEISRLTKRIEEIKNIDKENLSTKDRIALRKEAKAIKENVRKDDVYVLTGTTLVILIIILLML